LQVDGDTGAPFACPNYSTKSIQVVGTFGGATVTIEGSNMIDNPTYAPQVDNLEVAITFTSEGIKQIFSNTYWIRPRISSGAGATTNLDFYLVAHTER
jgi:hypothetical protein